MLRESWLLRFAGVAVVALIATGCGGSKTSGVEYVTLVDRSTSFCQLLPHCQDKIDGAVADQVATLSKHGGELRVLLIGNDTGGPVDASENPQCGGVTRGAAACFAKPGLLDPIFGKSGTQKKAALKKIEDDIAAGLNSSKTIYGTSIIDAIGSAQHFLDDRRLPNGDRQLLILSDMIEDSHTDIPSLTCVNVGTPEQNRHVLARLRSQGRLPDLSYVEVQVLGAGAKNSRNGACRESFWRAFFDATNAQLDVYQGL
jgi:hypothetical protein